MEGIGWASCVCTGWERILGIRIVLSVMSASRLLDVEGRDCGICVSSKCFNVSVA